MSAADLGDAYDANALLDVWVANRRLYGVRKLWHAARRAGHDWGRDRVARLMGLTGIDGTVRGRRRTTTTERDKGAPPRHPDLINRAWSTPRRPDQWWVADFTYAWTLQGFCYTAFCVDVFSRRILGWRVMTSTTTPVVTSVLEQALFIRRYSEFQFTATGWVHHSDAGSQYTSIAFTDALAEAGITGSIGSTDRAMRTASSASVLPTPRRCPAGIAEGSATGKPPPRRVRPHRSQHLRSRQAPDTVFGNTASSRFPRCVRG